MSLDYEMRSSPRTSRYEADEPGDGTYGPVDTGKSKSPRLAAAPRHEDATSMARTSAARGARESAQTMSACHSVNQYSVVVCFAPLPFTNSASRRSTVPRRSICSRFRLTRARMLRRPLAPFTVPGGASEWGPSVQDTHPRSSTRHRVPYHKKLRCRYRKKNPPGGLHHAHKKGTHQKISTLVRNRVKKNDLRAWIVSSKWSMCGVGVGLAGPHGGLRKGQAQPKSTTRRASRSQQRRRTTRWHLRGPVS
jgi:hypothetical protein